MLGRYTCVAVLRRYFPNCHNQISKMENISSPELIKRLSEEDIDNFVPHNLTLVTVGHVCYNKGIDFAIEAVDILKNNEIDFLWLFVGAITESKWIEEVKRKGLQKYFKFVGVQSNPIHTYVKLIYMYTHLVSRVNLLRLMRRKYCASLLS